MDEMQIAMKELKLAKSPGSDGLPVEYYRVFWDKIKNVMYHTFQEVMQK